MKDKILRKIILSLLRFIHHPVDLQNIQNHILKKIGFGIGGYMETSGEVFVLKKFLDLKKQNIVFDVGANYGKYTNLIKSVDGKAKIYAFEPLESTLKEYKDNVELTNDIKIFPIGFSNKKSEAYIYHTAKDAGLSSVFNRNLSELKINFENKSKIELSTLDLFCYENNINEIDFLKIDVEGNEYNVLLGAKELLVSKKIRVLQFEFGGTCIDARIFFRDFWELLNSNYSLFRINNTSLIEISSYDTSLEVFKNCNYIGVLKK